MLPQGVLCDLDVGEESTLHDTLIMDGLQPVRTVLESDFGSAICDVNYFHSLQDRPREQRLFVCGDYSQDKYRQQSSPVLEVFNSPADS